MAEKNYEAYQAAINALREFASHEGWSIASEKEIDYGYQMVVFDGITKNPVDFFPSGKILVQGKPGALHTQLLAWREERSSSSPSKYEKAQLPFAGAQSQQSLLTGTTIATGVARIGMDESGKGDYFALAAEIRAICPYSVVTIGPKHYNEVYEKIQNLNSLLAWGHARALENVLEKVSCNLAIADQFGNEAVLQNALLKRGRQIKLEQRPRAEEDVAVAAASILARAEFVRRLEQLSKQIGKTLPKGASDPLIVTVGREIVAKGGRDALAEVAKLHFKTTGKILQDM